VNVAQWMVFFHVLFIVAAIGVTVFPGLLLGQIAMTGDAAAIAKAYGRGMYHGRVGGLLLIIAVLFGFAAASMSHFPLTSGWLIAGYAAVIINIITGAFLHSRHEAEIYAAATSGKPDAGAECARLARRPVVGITNAVSGIVWLFAIFAMVMKPF
jgi:hypothetical protein